MNENYKIMRFKPFGISHSPAFLRELIMFETIVAVKIQLVDFDISCKTNFSMI